MKTIIRFVLFAYILGCKAPQGVESVQNDYQQSLEKTLQNIHSTNSSKQIERSIPSNSQEALFYFSIDYNDELSADFRALRKKTVALCLAGEIGTLTKYIYLSEFVDGYFAEYYFDSMEEIMTQQAVLACPILRGDSSDRTRRLTEIKQKFCK